MKQSGAPNPAAGLPHTRPQAVPARWWLPGPAGVRVPHSGPALQASDPAKPVLVRQMAGLSRCACSCDHRISGRMKGSCQEVIL